MGCPRCRTLNAPGARFCTGCGAAFVDAAVPPTERRRVAGCALMALLLVVALLRAV